MSDVQNQVKAEVPAETAESVDRMLLIQEQVGKPWSEQNTAAKYLRKLMVEHFKANVEDVDALWKDGLEPPLCESDFIIYG